MSIYARAFSVGDLFTETFAIFTANWRPVVIYAAVLAVVASTVQWAVGVNVADTSKMFGNAAVYTWLIMLITNVVNYFLMWQVLANLGLATTERSAKLIIINIVAAIVMTLGMIFGFALLIVPGLIVMARWSVAPQLIVGRGAGLIDAMRESWGLTGSRQWTIVGFYFLFGLAMVAVLAPLSFGALALKLNAGVDSGTAAGIAVQFVQSAVQYVVTGVGLCANVALFALLLERSGAEEEIFA